MTNQPPPNPPETGYEKGLPSFMFEPLKEILITLFGNSGQFDHTSVMYNELREVAYDEEYPCLMFHIPGGNSEPDGIRQKKWVFNLEIFYYTKQLKDQGYAAREISHFIEQGTVIIQTHRKITLENGGCLVLKGVDSFETDFFVDNSFIISMGMLSVAVDAKLCIIPGISQ